MPGSLSEAEVRDAIDRGPLLAEEARQAKLVDRLGYRDQVIAEAHSRAGSGAELTSLTTYLDHAGRPHRDGATIAVIYGTGLIQRNASSANPLSEANVMAANEITRAFRAAVRDAAVRAIIFRIDSPGGSVVASESIWREVVFARERGKPVIVSMGDVAGSGGYYVAAPADKIVAEPATLTGSIGVLAGKFVRVRSLPETRHVDGFRANRRQRGDVQQHLRILGARPQPSRGVSRRDLQGFQGPRRLRTAHDPRGGRGRRQGSGLVG